MILTSLGKRSPSASKPKGGEKRGLLKDAIRELRAAQDDDAALEAFEAAMAIHSMPDSD